MAEPKESRQLSKRQSILGERHCKHTTGSRSASLEMSVVPIRAGQSPVRYICNVEIIEYTALCGMKMSQTESYALSISVWQSDYYVSICIYFTLFGWIFGQMSDVLCFFYGRIKLNPNQFGIWQMCGKWHKKVKLLTLNVLISTL